MKSRSGLSSSSTSSARSASVIFASCAALSDGDPGTRDAPARELLQLEFDRPAVVRIQGLAIGIDVGADDYADAIRDKCRRNGLLVSTEGSTVLLLPSLAIDKRTAARGLDILARSI